jgi:hypothetical protein
MRSDCTLCSSLLYHHRCQHHHHHHHHHHLLLLLPMLPCRLEKGTTYNAYLIFGETHTALVDASHEKFSNLFIATLKQELVAAGRGIDYILVRNNAVCGCPVCKHLI